MLGLFIEMLHVAINVSYVYFREGYDHFTPHDGFIFIPQFSQIVSHSRALLAWDERVDLWLVTVWRQLGHTRALTILLVLLAFAFAAAWRLIDAVRKSESTEQPHPAPYLM
jgi:hypothetical protein